MKRKPPITPAFVPYDPTIAKQDTSMVVYIPRECCHDGCRRVSTLAFKLSDFWLSSCERHTGQQLSINKALAQLGKLLQKRGAA